MKKEKVLFAGAFKGTSLFNLFSWPFKNKFEILNPEKISDDIPSLEENPAVVIFKCTGRQDNDSAFFEACAQKGIPLIILEPEGGTIHWDRSVLKEAPVKLMLYVE